MPRIAAKILRYLASVAYVLLSLLPGGTTLCIGGGHHWSELIAAQCEHGGHHDGDLAAPAAGPESCLACEHHAHDHHPPCTDIEAPEFDVRVQQGDRELPAISEIATSMPAWSIVPLDRGCIATGRLTSTICGRAGPVYGLPHDVAASLRAVVLLI